MRWITQVVAVCLSAATATAQMAGGPQFYHVSIGIAGGFTIPTGNATTPINTGYNGQAYVLIRPVKFLPAIRLNVGYQRSSYKSDSTPSGFSSGASVPGYLGRTREVLSGVGGLNINLFHIGPVTPYILAGVGAFNIRTTVDTAQINNTTTAGKTLSTFNFGIDGGAGLALALGRVSMFAEGRVQNVYTNGGGFIKSSKQILAVPVSFGLAVGLF